MVAMLSAREAKDNGFNLAFNLADLTSHSREMAILIMALIRPVLDPDFAIDFDHRKIAEVYAVAKMADDRASAIVEVIRRKLPRYMLRMRVLKRDRSEAGRWVRV